MPKLERAIANEKLPAATRKDLVGVRDRVRDIEIRANSSLGLHYFMKVEKARARGYLKRALELLPASDSRRENIAKFLKMAQG